MDPEELRALEEERDFLLRSIDDLEREHAVGDIDDADYQALADGYTARTADVLRAIADQRSAHADERGRRPRGRTVLVIAAVLLVGAVSGVLVAQASGRRGTGQTATGNSVSTPTLEAEKCISLSATKVVDGINCFRKVLDESPNNPTALTYLGWTLIRTSNDLTGTTRDQARTAGSGFLGKAIAANRAFPDAYAFSAIVAFQDGDAAKAKQYLDTLETLHPPAQITALTSSLRSEVEAALKGSTTTVPGPSATTTTVPSTSTTVP